MYSQEYYKNMFIQKFNELERCYKEFSNYSMIQASSALRPLLFDSNPLLDILNREKQIPVYFAVNDSQLFSEEEIAAALLLWREINPLLGTVNLKKDAFLKRVCAYYHGKLITVLDIIRFYAYVRGGIHMDKGEEKYDWLREAFDLIKINQLSTLDHCMRGIVQVTYTTLKQYKEQLLS